MKVLISTWCAFIILGVGAVFVAQQETVAHNVTVAAQGYTKTVAAR